MHQGLPDSRYNNGLPCPDGGCQSGGRLHPILISTYVATLAGLISVAIAQKINLFNRVVLAYLGGLTAIIAGIVWYFSTLPQEQINLISTFAANFILFSIIISFIVMAMVKKVNVYETFIEGAKDGFKTAITIIPYLVAILVAIGVFRASGAMDLLVDGITAVVAWMGIDTSFTEALPTALMKPLSGSGSRGMMIDAMTTHGQTHLSAGWHAASRVQPTQSSTYWPSTSALSGSRIHGMP
jgi:spore maturation protein SpmB